MGWKGSNSTHCVRLAVVKKLQVKYVIPKSSHKLCFLKTNLKVGIKEGNELTYLTSRVISFQSEPGSACLPRGVMTHREDFNLPG